MKSLSILWVVRQLQNNNYYLFSNECYHYYFFFFEVLKGVLDLKTQMANYKEKISKLYEKKFKSLKKNLDHEFQEKLSLQKYNFH